MKWFRRRNFLNCILRSVNASSSSKYCWFSWFLFVRFFRGAPQAWRWTFWWGCHNLILLCLTRTQKISLSLSHYLWAFAIVGVRHRRMWSGETAMTAFLGGGKSAINNTRKQNKCLWVWISKTLSSTAHDRTFSIFALPTQHKLTTRLLRLERNRKPNISILKQQL